MQHTFHTSSLNRCHLSPKGGHLFHEGGHLFPQRGHLFHKGGHLFHKSQYPFLESFKNLQIFPDLCMLDVCCMYVLCMFYVCYMYVIIYLYYWTSNVLITINVCCNYELQRGPVSSLIKLYRFRAGLSAAINR